MILGVLLLLALLAGCAASPPQVQAPPIPTDIGWQMPQVTTMANVSDLAGSGSWPSSGARTRDSSAPVM
jgi:hypothetical protein